MKKMEVVRKLLTYIGKDAEEDKVIAEACLMLMPEEPKKEEPKKEETKKGRKPFDMGKLIALIDGGWAVPKIADEMGVSEQTIRNRMKQLESVPCESWLVGEAEQVGGKAKVR